MNQGHVYILTNPSMPGLVKVGKTTRSPEERAAQLNSTGVPMPFEVWGSYFSPDCHMLEAKAHAILDEFRVSDSREFFRCSEEAAHNVVCGLQVDQVKYWVDSYMPGWEIAHPKYCVNVTAISPLCEEIGVTAAEAIVALQSLTRDELSEIVKRCREDGRKIDFSRVERGQAS